MPNPQNPRNRTAAGFTADPSDYGIDSDAGGTYYLVHKPTRIATCSGLRISAVCALEVVREDEHDQGCAASFLETIEEYGEYSPVESTAKLVHLPGVDATGRLCAEDIDDLRAELVRMQALIAEGLARLGAK